MLTKKLKKGVSLVTVLIFMMVATIAATATYKWLNAVGFTSADRMALAEAKESSHAGLDAVRSWMTYHANDVGAIIRQYYDGGKKPVALTNVVHGVSSNKQKFAVWLTGVDASRDTYKFTVVSTGTSRTDAKYSETAILNVRGLYKVKVPVKITHKAIDFGYSYFGGSTKTGNNVRTTSMLVNGNWDGNPPIVDEDFVVTGNAELTGNNLSLGNHTCIGGDFKAENNGVTGRNFYIHGNGLSFGATISGNAYFNGNASLNQTMSLSVVGDLTVNGTLSTAQGRGGVVNGNFCMGDKGKFKFNDDSHAFSANGNIKFLNSNGAVETPYVDGNNNEGGERLAYAWAVETPYVDGNNNWNYNQVLVNLGGTGKKLYSPEGKSCVVARSSVCSKVPQNEKSSFVRFRHSSDKAHLTRTKANVVEKASSDMNCDESVKDYCLGILGKEQKRSGCENSDFKIGDMITTAFSYFKLMGKTSCGDMKIEQGKSYNMQTLNNCYNNAGESELYNGYLVVKLNKEQTTTLFYEPTGTLNGKFIFYSEEYIPGTLKLPPTTASSSVFIYLGKGAETINTTSGGNIGDARNYFVYSKENINTLMNDATNHKYTGSFYLTAESCAKIKDVNSADMNLVYNPTLVQDLIDNAVICNISEEGSCGTPVSTGSGDVNTSGEDNVEGFDVYYVATAPQLSITLESQRRNKEVEYDNLKSSEYTTVKPSIVVMPRIVYLDQTPEGKLQDYFNVVNLNGATETFNAANTSCKPSLNPTGLLYTDEKLEPEIYDCEYTASKTAYGKNKFWVVVDGDVAGKSRVSFDKEYSRILANSKDPSVVSLVVDANQSAPVTVTIKATKVPSGWTMTKADVVNPQGDADVDGSRMYTLTVDPGTVTPLFSVKADEDADKNLMSFTIEGLSANARLGNPSTSTLQMTGEGFVNRRDITSDFCNDGNHKEIDGVPCVDIVKRADCSENLTSGAVGEWVTADCDGRYTLEPNNSWQCSFAGTSGIKLGPTGSSSEFCDLFIYDSTLTELDDGLSYYLYASYKAKVFNFTLVLDGVQHSSEVKAYITPEAVNVRTFDKSDYTPRVCRDSCVFDVPAGYHVLFEPVRKGDNFSKWLVGGKDTSDIVLHVLATSDTLVRAVFNESDDHCFYSDFKKTQIWCDSDISDCIDKCSHYTNSSPSCDVDGGAYGKASWIIPHTNKGKDYMSPDKDLSSFLFHNSSKNASNSSSKISYLLNRAEAGNHGKMTSNFKTCSISKMDDQARLNDGFVLRASRDMSHYAIVNILGLTNGGSYQMVARVCYGDGSGIKNAQSGKGNCSSASFPGMIVPVDNFSSRIFNAEIDLRANKADITLKYKDDSQWKTSMVSLDINVAATQNPGDHFVGASMASDCFKIGNIGWEAYDWGENSCQDIPQVSCSFAANYLGGVLPVNESVTPWVSTTSWFSDPMDALKLRHGCSISYHYNGCDLGDGYSTGTCSQWIDGSTHCSGCNHMSDEGPYFVSGVNAEKMKNETYAFTYVGSHGTPKEYLYNGDTYDGTLRDASIVVDCGNEGLFTRSCGRFSVGKLTQCAQSVGFRVSDCNDGPECTVSVVGGSANLRASSLVGEITGLPDADASGNPPVISMVLKDANGNSSQEIQISGNGNFSRDVNMYSDMQNFNPEQVAYIEFSSAYNFSLTKLQSDCPNSIGVYNCSAEFNGDRIEIKSGIVNALGATCKVEGVGNEYKLTERDCPTNGAFTIPAVKLQEAINESNDAARDYTFKITVTSKSNKNLEETCTTPPMTVNGSGLRCELGTGIDQLKPGDQIPLFYYAVSNCPSSGCEVDLSLNNGNRPSPAKVYNKGGELDSWVAAGTLNPGTYTYKVEYAGSMCYKSFMVSASTTNKKLDNCAIDEGSKTFTADLNLPTGSKSTLKLAVTDAMGNTVGSVLEDEKNSKDKTYSRKLPDIKNPGTYLVVLSTGTGENAESCTVNYTVEDTSGELPSDLGCYIDEYGRFKTKVKNNTKEGMDIALNCGPVGETWGNTVSNGQWEVGTVVDLDAYLNTQGNDCKEYHLWSSKFLCAVARPQKNAEEGEPSGKCGVYETGGKKVNGNVKKGQFVFKVTEIKNIPDGAKISLAGETVIVKDGEAFRNVWTGEGNGTIQYSAEYDGKGICTVDLNVKNK